MPRSLSVAFAAAMLAGIAAAPAHALTPTPPIPTPTPLPPELVCYDQANIVDTFTNVTPTSATYRWELPGCTYPITEWRVLVDNGRFFKQVSTSGRTPWGGTVEITGLEPGVEHTVRLELSGFVSFPYSHTSTFRTPSEPDPTVEPPTPTPEPSETPSPTPAPVQVFASSGSMLLRTAGAAGTFPATQSVSLDLPADGGDGPVAGSLAARTTPGTLVLGGLIPAKTVVTYSGGMLTGSTTGGKLTATAGGAISIGKTTVLGITLNSSTNCRTVGDAQLALAGTVTGAGGKLAGAIKLPKFTNCGTLGSFLGTTSAKSAISLALAPVPVATS